jgi:hypothetical protein
VASFVFIRLSPSVPAGCVSRRTEMSGFSSSNASMSASAAATFASAFCVRYVISTVPSSDPPPPALHAANGTASATMPAPATSTLLVGELFIFTSL